MVVYILAQMLLKTKVEVQYLLNNLLEEYKIKKDYEESFYS